MNINKNYYRELVHEKKNHDFTQESNELYRIGIKPNQLSNNTVKSSFNLHCVNHYEHDHKNKEKDTELVPQTNYLIIDHKGAFYRYWKIFYVACCLTSCFLYGFNAAFKG